MGLFLPDVPEAPGKPKVEEITSEGASLTWKPPPSDGGAPITEYKVQKRKRGDTKWDDVITAEPITEPNCKVLLHSGSFLKMSNFPQRYVMFALKKITHQISNCLTGTGSRSRKGI